MPPRDIPPEEINIFKTLSQIVYYRWKFWRAKRSNDPYEQIFLAPQYEEWVIKLIRDVYKYMKHHYNDESFANKHIEYR